MKIYAVFNSFFLMVKICSLLVFYQKVKYTTKTYIESELKVKM